MKTDEEFRALVDLNNNLTSHRDELIEKLAEAQKQNVILRDALEKAKSLPMKYKRMAFNAELQDENAQMYKELAEAQKQIVMLREALDELATLMDEVIAGNYKPDSFTCQPARKALAATDGMKDCILCDAEPVGYFEQTYMGGPVIFSQVNYSKKDRDGILPLYQPRIAK